MSSSEKHIQTQYTKSSNLGAILLLAIFTLVLNACASKKKIHESKPLKNKSTSYLLKKSEQSRMNFDWVGMKISAEFKDGKGVEESFAANVKMQKDSTIWISVSPALGVEVFRILATPDSLKVVSKIPKNKYYSIGSMDMLSNIVGAQLDFSSLQDIFIGNGYDFDTDDSKYRSTIDDQQYVLISKYKRKVMKVVGENDKHIDPDDTLSVVNEKKYDKAVDKMDEDELMIRRYWLNGETYQLERILINDLFNQRTIRVEYDEFKTVEGQSYPSNGRLIITDPDHTIDLSFKISRIKLNKTYEFPFDIPEDFEERKF